MINETTITMYGRRISLHDIREKLLKDHEELGILRLINPSEDKNLSDSEIDSALVTRHISFDTNDSIARKRELLQAAQHCRHFKIWHDHAAIAGRGHFMVLVSCLYDPAFYYNPQELAKKGNNVDVISIVEKPEIHLLAQNGSSDSEQMLYNEPRSESLIDIDVPISTSSNHPVTDTVRFFHGDLPAREFEAGHNRGGNYPCTACQTNVHRYDDLTYVFRMKMVTLENHQKFMLDGNAWKRGGSRPFQGLTKQELQTELTARVKNGSYTRQPLAPYITLMTKGKLETELSDLRKGYCNFPALTAIDPEANLEELHLNKYKVAPTEPLHDFKGHMANIIGEVRATVKGAIKEDVEKVYITTLKKDTTRGVDYRKATILFSNLFDKTCPDPDLHSLFNTAVQICDLVYSRETSRCQRTLLRLHNLTLQHAVQCVDMFYSISKVKMFGSYFQSLVVHAPVLYRLVALRSVNSELQERMFNTCNDITLTTSNRHTSGILNDILVRVQSEAKVVNTTLQKQDGEVRSLASSLKPFTNTQFSWHGSRTTKTYGKPTLSE